MWGIVLILMMDCLFDGQPLGERTGVWVEPGKLEVCFEEPLLSSSFQID